ncbi:MAG TPA: biotin--[acetyl-CoA-carboxylase] ligase [Bryobacteraceae bacterium]|jgi:BirA family biotin operon repressor/biotin-[acetyl-CoA-carboxylase] ligase
MNLDRLRAAFPTRAIEHHAVVRSTMERAAGQPPGAIVLADEQTGGRGRHGHSWYSEPHSGIYFSTVLAPAPLLTLALGLATAEAIARSAGISCDLRWPNDVLLGGKKVAGVLVELVNGSALAGIGINVNHTVFPPDLAREATSLRLHAGREFDRTDILLALIPAIGTFVALDNDSILRLFAQSSSYAAGRRVTVDQPGGRIEGTTAGLDSSGYLVVRRDDGTDTLILAGGVRAAGS